MKSSTFFLSCIILTVVVFGGCLKSTPYMDVSNTQPIIEFGISPANGYNEPMVFDTSSLQTDADTAVGLLIASPQVLTKAYTFQVAIDTSQINAYNATFGDPNVYTLMPKNLYVMPDTVSVTIPAGYRIGRIPITLKLSQLPVLTPYALPLKIIDGGGLLISGAAFPYNTGQFMWMFYRAY
jgi:hypothetical protein